MSGGASVPFAIWAIFAGEKYQQVILAVVSVFCVSFAAWRLWAAEREKVIELHGQMDIVAATREQTEAIRAQTEENRLAREQAQMASLFKPVTFVQPSLDESGPRQIKLEIGEDGQFVTTRHRNLYSRWRTLNLCIINLDSKKPLENIKAKVTALSPYAGTDPPWIMVDDFKLNGGDGLCTPLAKYGEAADREKFNCADSFFLLCVYGKEPALGADAIHAVTIRVTARDAHFEEIRVTLWVDSDGHLRISELLPLRSAVETAYGKIHGTALAGEIETLARTPTAINVLVANQFLKRGAIWGKRYPTTDLARVDPGTLNPGEDLDSLHYTGHVDPIVRDLWVQQREVDEFVRYVQSISGSI